jgi:hypothetical protein
MSASIARGFPAFPPPEGFIDPVPIGVDVEAVSSVLAIASDASATAGGALGGTYASRRPSSATSSPGRDPAACVPALTKFIPLGFLSASKLAANSS